jgi:uncharacterized protein (DUF305 family)
MQEFAMQEFAMRGTAAGTSTTPAGEPAVETAAEPAATAAQRAAEAAADKATDGPAAGAPSQATDTGGASDTGTGPDEDLPAERRSRGLRLRLLWAPFVLLAALALVAGGAGLRGVLERSPGTGSVDAGFLRDMSEHHAQAVQMAMLEFGHGVDPDVVAVAQDIALTQQREIGIMGSWLSGWGLSQSTGGAPMLWMTPSASAAMSEHMHDGDAGSATGPAAGSGAVRMPGMATDAQLTQLATSSGRASDILFLTLMVHHHRGGLAMAQDASLHAGEDEVRTLARAMVVVQSAEIDQMQAYLTRLGAPRA